MDSKITRLLSRVCAFCEEEQHAIMDRLFVPFQIIVSIIKHVELQNVAKTLMDQAHEQELGSLIIQNKLRGMELGNQL